MKSGTTDLLKFKKLQRRLGLTTWQAVGILETLWHQTVKNAPAGDIGKFSDEDIAAMLDYSGSDSELIATLVDSGWLDRDDEYRLVVHDWSEHVPTYLKGNFAKHGKMFANELAKQRAKQPISTPKTPAEPVSEPATYPNQTNPDQSHPNPQGEHDDELHGWLVWWNELHSQKLVPAGVCVDKPSEGVLAGWRRVKKSAALRDMLTDRDKLAADIRGSPLLRSGWFRLEKLFGGKNSDGEYILTKLTQGGYRDNGKPAQQQRVTDGQRFNSSGRFTGT